MLEIVWRNPQPPARRSLKIAITVADESTKGPMWIIYYQTLLESGWPESEFRLLVNRKTAPNRLAG